MIVTLLSLLFLCHSAIEANSRAPKILHISFHHGCIKDFEEVGKELSLDLTSWYVLSSDLPRMHFDGKTTGNAVYNLTHQRALDVWNKHKDYFYQFDAIITSDTAPLSRIFLQNGWEKPLIIWINNRFDYYDGASLDGPFPDAEYYDLFRRALNQKNVRVIGYTEYEHHYAGLKGVHTDGFTIKPLGTTKANFRDDGRSYIPQDVVKSETLFIYPRLDENQLVHLKQQCAQLGFKTYSGVYNGPCDLDGFKGIIYFPYAWSNYAVYENMERGLIHFVPSVHFIRTMAQTNLPIKYITLDLFHLIEWYKPEYKDLLVYFDSWQDLRNKVRTLDYAQMSEKNKLFAQHHRKTQLKHWYRVFEDFKLLS